MTEVHPNVPLTITPLAQKRKRQEWVMQGLAIGIAVASLFAGITLYSPVDCDLSDWSPWTNVTPSADDFIQVCAVRTRHVARNARNGGRQCTGKLNQIKVCDPVDCILSDWSNWKSFHNPQNNTYCAIRTRSVAQVAMYGGKACTGELQERRTCAPVSTFAGIWPYGLRKGNRSSAQFNWPSSVVFDSSGNLFIADYENHVVRKIDRNGEVSIYAGTDTSGLKDGHRLSAQFASPCVLLFDSDGNLFVTDSDNHAIRKIDLMGQVTTVAGNGKSGYQNGDAVIAQFNWPTGMVFDREGNLLVTDSYNHVIRMIDTNDEVSTFAGTGVDGRANGPRLSAEFGFPIGLAFDGSGKLLVAEGWSDVIRIIDAEGEVSIYAGTGSTGLSNGDRLMAEFNYPADLEFDASGNLYVVDCGNHVIRRIDANGNVSTFAGLNVLEGGFIDGDRQFAEFLNPSDMTFDKDGNMIIADGGNHVIRKIDTNGVVSTVAGIRSTGQRNGDRLSAQFCRPSGFAFDTSGNLFVADAGNNLIRKIGRDGDVSTFAGTGESGLTNKDRLLAQFNTPKSLVFDSNGNLYIADSGNHVIRMINEAGMVCTFAGSGSIGSEDGDRFTAQFNNPQSLTIDKNDNLYVADTGNHLIRRIDTNGFVSTLARRSTSIGGNFIGMGIQSYDDKPFNAPQSVAVDANGNLFIADTDNHMIRKIDPSGAVSTFAGTGTSGFTDGDRLSAQFSRPEGLAVDSAGNLFVSDTGNYVIRLIDTDGIVSTLTGTGESALKDDEYLLASFTNPAAVALDRFGDLLVADQHVIRKIAISQS